MLIIAFLFGILAGSRADYLLPIIILILLILDGNILNRYYFPKLSLVIKRYVKIILLVFFGFIFAISFAVFRQDVNIDLLTIVVEHFGDLTSFLFVEINGQEIFWMETVNHVIGGLYSMVQQIELGYMDYHYGSDYLNFIPRTLPGVMRPESFNMLDLSQQTQIDGEMITQGGIFETAEAYVNFGFIGCFMVSFFISFVFAWLLKKGKRDLSVFFMSL